MRYRKDRYGNEISVLGFGCMRFSRSAGKISMDKAEKELMTAYNLGVNYYDTAYTYPGSETALGEIIEKNGIRDSVYIATKLPHYMVKTKDDLDKYLNRQLERLRTDHIDYYLMHMLSDIKSWKRLKDLGICEWLKEKASEGKIRQVGFSYHGNTDMFIKILDDHDWDFCQIQYNYLDENTQAGRRGYEYAAEKNIPVIIMEPLRGGKLVNNLPNEALQLFADHDISRTPAGWAFSWLWDQKNIMCVLSGMNSVEMVEENVHAACEAEEGMLSENDRMMLSGVVDAINENIKVGCTGCGYCMPCPHNVDIPGTFAAYNRKYSDGWLSGLSDYVMCTAMRNDNTSAANCIGCGKCEKMCPQAIEIRKELKNARKALHGIAYSLARLFFKMTRYK